MQIGDTINENKPAEINLMSDEFTEAELEAFLEEALDPVRASEIEQALRDDQDLLFRLSRINARRDAGMHTIGEIWRRYQIGVPPNEDLGKYLLGILSEEHADYIRFRLEVLKCPYTIASLKDLEEKQDDSQAQIETRQKKYYNSSAGLLKPKPGEES